MRTMTTINWVRVQTRDMQGNHFATRHTGKRGSWDFTIVTPVGEAPKLIADSTDCRRVIQEHRSLKAAKNAALELLHPSEAMGWNANQGTGPIQYRAQWDSRIFVVFETAADSLAFQWRDTETGYRSDVYPVSGIREAREMAAAVLRDSYPTETPSEAPQPSDDPRAALGLALSAAGIDYTPDQLAAAADALAFSILRP